jgi:putative ABC transport system permease protein
MDAFFSDLRDAIRRLRRSPAFTLAAVATLALGIGANTAVFSVLDGVAFKSLPVRAPGELVLLKHPSFSYPIFREVKARGEGFSSVFAWDERRVHIVWNAGGEPQPTAAIVVSGEFHEGLGVRAVAGRAIEPSDDRAGATLVAVLSHDSWRRRFAGDPAVLGRIIRVEGVPFTIVGVTPPEFFGASPGSAPEVTMPLAAAPLLRARDRDILERPSAAWLKIMARLEPGLDARQANAAFQTSWPQALEATMGPDVPPDRRQRYLSRATELISARTGHSSVRNEFTRPLWLLLGLVVLLLLAACATVGNLMLARASARTREVAVRIALGASRGRIVRELLTEGLALVVAGAAGGVLLASWGSAGLVALLSTSESPIVLDLRPDARVLAFTILAAVLTGAGFALAPALRATRVDPAPALQGARIVGQDIHRSRLGRSLVVSQVAVSMVLLVGTALFSRSLLHLVSIDPGFQTKNVVLLGADPTAAGYDDVRRVGFYRELLDRLGRVPGVESASLSWFPPMSDKAGSWTETVSIDGAPAPSDPGGQTYFNAVSAGYFGTLGIPVVRGRDFGPHDVVSGPRTVIINEALARAYFPGQDPIGRLLGVGRDPSRQGLEIVGIVKDTKYQRLQEEARRIAYLPYLQLAELLKGVDLVAEVRTAVPAAAMTGTLRDEVRAIDRAVPLRIETLTGRIRDSLTTERVVAIVSSVLTAVALLLASTGLYGLMAYAVWPVWAP